MSLLAIPRSLVLGAILVTTASFGCGDGTRVTSPSSRQDGLRQVTTVEPSRLVSCTVSWAAAVSGSWADATKWSTGAIPTAADEVCITVNGTYTVTVNGVRAAQSIAIGSPANTLNPTVNISASGSGSSLTAATSIVNHGTISMTWLTGTNGTASIIAVTDGTLENHGTLQTLPDGIGAPRFIRANLVNHGLVSIGHATNFDKPNGVYENRGTFNVPRTVNMVSGLGQRFLQSDGTLTVSSTFSVNAESFDFQGGEITGAVTLTGGTLLIGDGCDGAGEFHVRAASTLVGNIGANMLVRIIGIGTGSTLTSAAGYTNAGTIDLLWSGSGTNGTHSTLAVTEGTLTNTGTIRTLTDGIGSPRFIRASVINEGTISIEHQTQLDKQDAVYENRGNWNILTNRPLTMATGVNQRFVQSAGELSVAGTFNVSKESFHHDGGTISGAVSITDAALSIGDGSTGAATFNVRGASTLTGNVAAGQLIRIQGIGTGSTLTSATGFTNAGTIELSWAGGTNGTHATLAATSGTITNSGTIRTLTDGIGSPRIISGSLLNTGTVSIEHQTTFNKPGATYENRGAFNIMASRPVTITSAAGQTFRQSAGTLAATGSLTMLGGTFEVEGGTITGSPVVQDGLLHFMPGATGTGRVVVRGTAATLAGDVPAGWSVGISTAGIPSTIVTAASGFTNHGLIELAPLGANGNNGTGINLIVNGGTFRNAGTLRVNSDPFGGTGRTINADFVNDGTIELFSRTTLARANGTFRNNATIAFKANTFLFMSGLAQTFITTGQVTGPGTIDLNGVTFMGSGSVAANVNLTNVAAHIGTSGAASLAVTGIYRMITGGSLSVDVSNDPTPGTGHDRLTVSGTTTLLGTLNVAPIANGCIDPNLTFEIMGYAARVGDFTTKNGLNLGGGRTLTAQPSATNYRLVSSGSPCVAPDDTPPAIAPTVAGTLGSNGWYVSNVSVSWSVTDAESDISSREGCDAVTVTTDNAGITFTCSATSAGGSASQSVTVKRDATAPTVSSLRFPAANVHGWNNVDVTARYSATDAMSGLASSSPVDEIFSDEGANQPGSHTFTDMAGNSAVATVTGISIDRTAPVVTVTRSPLPGANGWNNTNVTVTYAATDALSGVNGATTFDQLFDQDGANQSGSHTFTDFAGNSATGTIAGINIDRTPLAAACSATPEEIWPANNKMVQVRVTVGGTGILSYALRSVTNNETGTADAAGWAIGTADLEGTVMATRLGSGNGRTYTLAYDLFGTSGTTTCMVTVRVPHDRRR